VEPIATNLPDPSLSVRAPVMALARGITLCRVVANACLATMPDEPFPTEKGGIATETGGQREVVAKVARRE
jgi:hypothetical protein